MRKLFLLGAERVDATGWDRIWAAWRDGGVRVMPERRGLARTLATDDASFVVFVPAGP